MPERCDLAHKRIYLSHDEAARTAGEYMSPYLCRWCVKWHIGHSSKQRREERRAGLREMVQEAEALGLYDQPEAKCSDINDSR